MSGHNGPLLGTMDTGSANVGALHDMQLDYYGQRAAAASSDNAVYIYDDSSNLQRAAAVLKAHDGPVWKVSWAHPKFGANRCSVVASGGYDMKVIVWKEVTPTQWQPAYVDTSHTASVNDVSFGPWTQGLQLASASSDGTVAVHTHSTQDQQWRRLSVAAHSGGAQALSWAPAPANMNGNSVPRLATAGHDCVVKVWRLENGVCTEEVPPLPRAHGDCVRTVAWRPDDSRIIASGGWDKTVIIWSQEAEGQRWTPAFKIPMADKVEGLSWSETGGILAVAYGEGDTSLYKDANDGTYVEVGNVKEKGFEEVPNSLISLGSAQQAAPETLMVDGVRLETITPGDGKTFPKPGDSLSMHYTGKIAASGVKFDSSLDRGEPFVFIIGHGNVIKGWDIGVMRMSLGQKALLVVPSDLGYGDEGAGGVIPPKAELHFEVQLLKIN